ncbi:MAG: delta-60 repeat domain-containing protein, partial [Bacteroidetes bacterium]|nr:delta-60 repeat domain-containing protein [Bacteroidota bacterium]
MKVLSALQFIIITCFIFFSQTRSQAVQSSFPVTNGNVYAIASSGSTVFLGGNFTYISPYSGNGVAINTATGNVINTFPTVTTPSTGITSVVPDGAGGFYIGGNFTQINGTSRTYIARLNSDGSLNAWNPVLNGSVSAIDISSDNNTIYVAGGFTQVNSTTRNHLAALSAADGSLTSWNPGLSGGNINAISLSTSGTIYVVGSFT